MELTFNKEDTGWYVDLPDYDGPKEDLVMVLGADTLLDILAQDDCVVRTFIYEEDPGTSDFELRRLKDESDGYWYLAKSEVFEFEVWLCKVTKFVFGHFPRELYLAKSSL